MPAPKPSPKAKSRSPFERFLSADERRELDRSGRYANEVKRRMAQGGDLEPGGKLPEPPPPTNMMSMDQLEAEVAKKKGRKKPKRRKPGSYGEVVTP